MTRERRAFVAGLGVVGAVALGLRLPHLLGGLPEVSYPDEILFATHAQALLDGPFRPNTEGVQPAVINLLALATGLARLLGAGVDELTDIVALGRIMFVIAGLAAVGFGTWVGALLADDSRRRWLPTVGTGMALAVSYQAVRTGRQITPDSLQLALVAASFGCTAVFDRTRRWSWLVGAGLLAGLAGAAKYLGILVVLAAVASVLWQTRPHDKVRQLALLSASTVVGFFVGAPATLVDPVGFADGIHTQLFRQSHGHLGYEPEGNGWFFHLGETLPGNWGVVLTVAGLLGTAAVVHRGTRVQRLSLAVVVPVGAAVGAFQARLPYYPMLLVPFLAAYAFVGAGRIGSAVGRRWTWVAAAVLFVSLGPSLLDDVRLVRVAGAPDTRVLASEAIADLAGPVWAERYTASTLRPGDVSLTSIAHYKDVTRCGCFVLLSSYWEERYRRRPDLYPGPVAAYDRVRALGRVIEVIAPDRHLSYRWDLLPTWGIRRIPLTGPTGPVGPTITVLDLRHPS